MIRRKSSTADVPERLRTFVPSEWPSETDPAYKAGTAYGEALGAWSAAWDAWQAGDPSRGAGVRLAAEEAAWSAFPDDPFDYEEI